MKRVKVFEERQSLFNQLLERSEHYAGLYNMAIIQLAFFMVVLLVKTIYSGGIDYVVGEMRVFGGPDDWLRWSVLELFQLSVALLIHPAFMVWRYLRRFGLFVDVIFILLYGVICLVTMAVVWGFLLSQQLAPIPRVVSTLEHMRLVMKSYSFIRENAVKVLHPWNKDDEEGPPLWYKGQMEPSVGSFRKYVYFLFAPTLLYRDHYPRLKRSVSWWNVGVYLTQFVLLAHAYRHLLVFLTPSSLKSDDLLSCFLGCLLLSEVATLMALLMVLHAWQNMTAELTLFADREFYTDWWNSESYTAYYRKWNIPIYDWLNAYVYQDLQPVIKNRWITAIITFFLSSLVHDYQLAAALGYFTPVFLVLFTGCGGMMYLVRPQKTSRLARGLTLTGLFGGVGLIMYFHVVEYAARTQCPHTLHYYVTPHCLFA